LRNRHAIAVLLLPALFSACATDLGYLWKQGGCLISSNTGTKDIASMVKDPKTPADTRIFLEKVRDIKGFAVKEIGLKENANFTRYKEIGRNYLVSVVQACDAVSFSAYYWRYPFLGKLPY
jgi:predicted aminopeptidase